MSLQFSMAVRNARLAAIESAIGASAILKIRSGAAPSNAAAADAGTVLATLALPSDYLGSPSNAVVSLLGSWADSSADASGTAGHFRIYASDGSTCHMQGSITATGGGGDMEVDNTSFAAGQAFSISAFSISEANG